ncbi:MAG: hypothetical protein RDV48_31125 [Candidatus Eremiobacteraeota bacterium]|nr:hypothetical protein [Candidatus Eremiobacteraeota bacterium]
MKYSSNILVRLPLLVPALISTLISLAMFYVCFAETSIQVPSFVEKSCIFIMAAFLLWLAFTFIKIGIRDFYVAIEPQDDGLRFEGLFQKVFLRWNEIKQVQESASTLMITASDGMTLNVSADLIGFDEFRSLVMAKKPGVALSPPPVSPEDINRKDG